MQPAVRADLQVGTGLVAILVEPVRGNAFLGNVVHLAGADLDLDRRAEGADEGGVQGLVAIGLGNGNVVLELAGNRLEQAVQGPSAR